MGRCLYREVFVVSTVGDAYSGEMIVVLMISRCPQWGGAHCAHEGRCPHWGHAQGACNRAGACRVHNGEIPMVGRCLWCLQWENAHNGGTICGAPDGEMLVMRQFLMVPVPGVFVPVVGSCLQFPCPGCLGQVRLEDTYAATTALQNLGFGGFFSPATPSRSESMCFFPVQILSYLGGKVKVEETDLKPRIGFLHDVNSRNISVFINATREQDSGQYMCSVNVEDDTIRLDKNIGVINLTVLGKALPVTLGAPHGDPRD